jgi:hypothetical protein
MRLALGALENADGLAQLEHVREVEDVLQDRVREEGGLVLGRARLVVVAAAGAAWRSRTRTRAGCARGGDRSRRGTGYRRDRPSAWAASPAAAQTPSGPQRSQTTHCACVAWSIGVGDEDGGRTARRRARVERAARSRSWGHLRNDVFLRRRRLWYADRALEEERERVLLGLVRVANTELV